MTDEYIRKQDAVDALDRIFDNVPMELTTEILRLRRELRGLSPADVVQVRHGKWKKIGEWGRVYRCNQCGNFLDFDGVNAGRGDANFCPNCGAKMDGGENG